MPTSIFQAFEESLRNRPERISTYTVRGYVTDLKRIAVWFEKTNGEPAYTVARHHPGGCPGLQGSPANDQEIQARND